MQKQMQNGHRTARIQAGFTLIELIIVIAILGLLSAVAVPNLTASQDEAKKARNSSILAAVKGAWAVAYSVKKSNPTVAEVAAQMSDPLCTGTTEIDCNGGSTTDPIIFSATLTGGVIATTRDLTCKTGTACL